MIFGGLLLGYPKGSDLLNHLPTFADQLPDVFVKLPLLCGMAPVLERILIADRRA